MKIISFYPLFYAIYSLRNPHLQRKMIRLAIFYSSSFDRLMRIEPRKGSIGKPEPRTLRAFAQGLYSRLSFFSFGRITKVQYPSFGFFL